MEVLAFQGTTRLAAGPVDEVLAQLRARKDEPGILFFDRDTGRQVDFDWSAPAPPKPGPGRPKLGVVSTEVTLLPRHWEWLNAQPGRASATLRRLVEQAMRAEATDPKARRDALGKILWALAGNLAGFEEACRCLYADDRPGLQGFADRWPGDLPDLVRTWV